MSSTIILIGQYWAIGQRDCERKSNFGDRERNREREKKERNAKRNNVFSQKKFQVD